MELKETKDDPKGKMKNRIDHTRPANSQSSWSWSLHSYFGNYDQIFDLMACEGVSVQKHIDPLIVEQPEQANLSHQNDKTFFGSIWFYLYNRNKYKNTWKQNSVSYMLIQNFGFSRGDGQFEFFGFQLIITETLSASSSGLDIS